MIKVIIRKVSAFFEIFFIPLILLASLIMYLYRRIGSKYLKISTLILKTIGIFPIRDHYYEPLFNHRHLKKDLRIPRELPGIDFNEQGQLDIIKKLNYQHEFIDFVNNSSQQTDEKSFDIYNKSFASGDAEFLFNFIRYIKPNKVIEIGCGTSTKIIQNALTINAKDNNSMSTHICIEPYEQSWLESFPNINLVREKVENLDMTIFQSLEDGDLLFIDSTHMIRPQGDVLHEYLSIIPSLQEGVYVHVHDIFSPRDYLDAWVKDDVKFWNEQYLLEALLSGNKNLEVVAALNFLKHKHFDKLKSVCTYLTPEREPGSFYFKTN